MLCEKMCKGIYFRHNIGKSTTQLHYRPLRCIQSRLKNVVSTRLLHFCLDVKKNVNIFAPVQVKKFDSMAKQVLVASGLPRVFKTLEEASEALGVSGSSISRSMNECRECQGHMFRYVNRVFAVQLKAGGEWRIVTRDSRNSGYILIEDAGKRIRQSDVSRVKDVTAVWYFSKEEW